MSKTSASVYMLYGDSGTRKTTELMTGALYVFEQTGRKCRFVSAESAAEEIVAPAVERELLATPLWMYKSLHPRAFLKKLQRGEWPYMVDSAGGRTDNPEKAVGRKWFPTPAEDWAGLGGYIFEGLQSYGELIMGDLRATQSKAGATGETGLASPGYSECDESLGSNAKSHYNAAQGDMLEFLTEAPKNVFDQSKGKVQYFFVSTHESKGTDGTNKTIFGPAVIGQAATDKVQKKVGLMVHHELVVTRVKDASGAEGLKHSVRAYFMPHPDSENASINWQAIVRLPFTADPQATQKAMGSLLKRWPGGYVDLDKETLWDFLKAMDEARAVAGGGLGELMERIERERKEGKG